VSSHEVGCAEGASWSFANWYSVDDDRKFDVDCAGAAQQRGQARICGLVLHLSDHAPADASKGGDVDDVQTTANSGGLERLDDLATRNSRSMSLVAS
jgi:hypothetical protein